MADTTTTLNTGTGGDTMDESAVVQGDGSTAAKRPRVEVALSADGIPRLVGKDAPLPITNDRIETLLQQIADDTREMLDLLLTFIHS